MGLMNSSHTGLIKYPFVCIIAVSNASLGRSGETDLTARLSKASEKDPLYLFIRRRCYSQLACLCSRRPVCIFIHRINPGISHAHARASPRTALFDRRGARLRQRRRLWSEAACRSNYWTGRWRARGASPAGRGNSGGGGGSALAGRVSLPSANPSSIFGLCFYGGVVMWHHVKLSSDPCQLWPWTFQREVKGLVLRSGSSQTFPLLSSRVSVNEGSRWIERENVVDEFEFVQLKKKKD